MSRSTDEMATIQCKCGGVMEEVLNMDIKKRVGWFCRTCSNFERAVGRELIINTGKINDQP